MKELGDSMRLALAGSGFSQFLFITPAVVAAMEARRRQRDGRVAVGDGIASTAAGGAPHAPSVTAFNGNPASRAIVVTVSTLVSATSHG